MRKQHIDLEQFIVQLSTGRRHLDSHINSNYLTLEEFEELKDKVYWAPLNNIISDFKNMEIEPNYLGSRNKQFSTTVMACIMERDEPVFREFIKEHFDVDLPDEDTKNSVVAELLSKKVVKLFIDQCKEYEFKFYASGQTGKYVEWEDQDPELIERLIS